EGFARNAASASARSDSASGTSWRGSSWSSSAPSRCSGESSGLPFRRASSCAAATASCDFRVSLLKSICLLVLSGRDRPRRLVEDELAPVLLVNVPNLFAHLALEALEARVGLAQLVLEPQDDFHAGQVEPELGCQPLDQAQPFQVGVGVEARVPTRPFRPDKAFALVDPQRLRMHADELCRDRDHVAGTIVHQLSSSLRGGPHIRFMTASPASYAVMPSFLRAMYARTSKYVHAATKIATISQRSGRSQRAP